MTFIKRTVTLAFLLMLEFVLIASGQMETTFQREVDADNPYLPSSFLPSVKILYKPL
ncbi:hypothetical protein HYR99_06425 [Candidatus Poribacteria bacterium]|nr:hypothetical protein [Candidatus Poribacteria bacterium]